jgi:hypothetical protein
MKGCSGIIRPSKRIAELEQKHCGGALMEREEHHVGVVNKLLERIAELEARTLNVKLPEPQDQCIRGAGCLHRKYPMLLGLSGSMRRRWHHFRRGE